MRALQELAVAVEVEGSYLRGRFADQVSVADEDLVIPPAQGFCDAPIGPPDDGAAGALLPPRQYRPAGTHGLVAALRTERAARCGARNRPEGSPPARAGGNRALIVSGAQIDGALGPAAGNQDG
jgi:hypothetical protein